MPRSTTKQSMPPALKCSRACAGVSATTTVTFVAVQAIDELGAQQRVGHQHQQLARLALAEAIQVLQAPRRPHPCFAAACRGSRSRRHRARAAASRRSRRRRSGCAASPDRAFSRSRMRQPSMSGRKMSSVITDGWNSRVSASAPAPLVADEPLEAGLACGVEQHLREARCRSRRSAPAGRPARRRCGRRRRR